MREVKSFFIEDNSLNKGYRNNGLKKAQDNAYYKKLQQNLPPVDVIAAYEELYPGTLEKLLAAVEKEQKHSHDCDHIHNKMYGKAVLMGRIFGFFSILTISYATVSLARSGMLMGGLIFAAMAFAAIFGVSWITTRANRSRSLGGAKSFDISNDVQDKHQENDKRSFQYRRYNRRNNRRPK